MKGKYSIGEFAKKTGQTIRTLHYYDEIGLLKPEVTADSGRRYYGDKNIIELQKIISLKFLGYSLEEVGEFIQTNDWDLKESLTFQKQEMLKKRAHIDKVIRTLDHALVVIDDQGKISASVFISIINNIQMESEHKEWLKGIMPKDQVEKLYDIPENKQQELNKRSAHLFTELKKAYGKDIDDKHVQKLIEDFFHIAKEIFGDIQEMLAELSKHNVTFDETNPLLFTSPFSIEEEEWAGKAMEYYMKNNGF